MEVCLCIKFIYLSGMRPASWEPFISSAYNMHRHGRRRRYLASFQSFGALHAFLSRQFVIAIFVFSYRPFESITRPCVSHACAAREIITWISYFIASKRHCAPSCWQFRFEHGVKYAGKECIFTEHFYYTTIFFMNLFDSVSRLTDISLANHRIGIAGKDASDMQKKYLYV